MGYSSNCLPGRRIAAIPEYIIPKLAIINPPNNSKKQTRYPNILISEMKAAIEDIGNMTRNNTLANIE
jgi:hypothetical protein